MIRGIDGHTTSLLLPPAALSLLMKGECGAAHACVAKRKGKEARVARTVWGCVTPLR